jgi:sterol desaturase/sphingolipid hydroxylase (fatty acid hydroxylase superfamily)
MGDLIMGGLLATYVLLLLLDVVRPARRFPSISGWRAKGLVFFVLYVVTSSALPLVWDEALGAHRLIDATGLGTIGGALAGFVVLELVLYAWHRALHRVPLLWRTFHQMHHSAERVDVFGAFYFSPLDMVGFTMVGSVSLVLIMGVTAEAAILANGAATLLAFVQHANIRTPRWLGYVVQRPEMHAVHHERGVHHYNYADLVLIDMLFGTFKNPATWEGAGGFYDGASQRIGDMLLFRDVSEPASAEDPTATRASVPG